MCCGRKLYYESTESAGLRLAMERNRAALEALFLKPDKPSPIQAWKNRIELLTKCQSRKVR